MMHQPRNQGRVRATGASLARARFRLAMALAAGMAAGGATAQDGAPPADRTRTDTSAAAPNQAVSLVPPDGSNGPSTDRDGPAGPIPETEENATPAGDAPRRAKRVTAVAPPAGTTIERESLVGRAARTTSDAEPWYRRGPIALILVLGLIGLGYLVVRRFVPAAKWSGGDVIRIAARTALSPKHNVVLVQVGRRFVVMGVSADRMQTLSEIVDAEEVAALAARTGAKLGSGQEGFDSLLWKEAAGFDDDTGRDGPVQTALGSGTDQRAGSPERAERPVTVLLNRLRELQPR